MVIMVLEKVPPGLRGELTHWLVEVRTGVYIGHVNAMVRDKLWDHCVKLRNAGRIFQAWSTNTEQHFKMRLEGDKDHRIVDWEGLQLVEEVGCKLKPAELRRIR